MSAKTHSSHARHVEPLLAAGATEVHADPHHQEAPPIIFTLSAEHIALIRSLHFLTEYDIAHLRKSSADVPNAFDESVLTAIAAHPELGGPGRADGIRAAKTRYQSLAAIAGIISPIARIVGQALLQTGASLALEASEPLKVARSLKASQPALMEKLATLDAWSRDHHGRGRTPAAAPKTPGAPAPA